MADGCLVVDGGVVVCRPSMFPRRRIMYCPTCDRRRRFAGREAAWYGATWTCLGCGDRWSDGEPCSRPFAPRWREKAIVAGKKTWEEAGAFSHADYQEWLRSEVGDG